MKNAKTRLPASQPVGSNSESDGGRKKLAQQEQGLMSALEALVESMIQGDPESPLRWTCHSTRRLAASLSFQGYQVSHQTVASLLDELG
jgi:hypothetical protein